MFVNNRQTLVATNDESEKKEYEAFEKLMRGEYEVPNSQKGWYYVHVTTEDGEPVDDDTLYALQLQMGDTYKHDYMTQEQSIDHTNVTEGDIALAKAEEASRQAAAKMTSFFISHISYRLNLFFIFQLYAHPTDTDAAQDIVSQQKENGKHQKQQGGNNGRHNHVHQKGKIKRHVRAEHVYNTADQHDHKNGHRKHGKNHVQDANSFDFYFHILSQGDAPLPLL